MRWAAEQPGALEREILARAEATPELLAQAGLRGSRRIGRLLLDDLSFEPHPEGVRFTFSLPKGSYATVVLREFMKRDAHLEE
jgi:tRNA pseudouridine13 synthase